MLSGAGLDSKKDWAFCQPVQYDTLQVKHSEHTLWKFLCFVSTRSLELFISCRFRIVQAACALSLYPID
jgi:hypothetical protein